MTHAHYIMTDYQSHTVPPRSTSVRAAVTWPRIWVSLLSMFAPLLTGCLATPKVKLPNFQPPAAFESHPEAAVYASETDLAVWWTQFDDDELTTLVRRGLQNNLDLELARDRLHESRATLRYTAYSDQLPSGGAVGQFSRDRTSQENPAVPKLGAVSAGNSGASLIPKQYGVYQAYFDASYELDIFGAQRHAVRAAAYDAQAKEDELRNTQVSTAAEIARDYMLLREYQQQAVLAERSLASERETLRIVDARMKVGLVTEADAARTKTEVAKFQASLRPLEQSEKQTRHAIAVLLGQDPLGLDGELGMRKNLPAAAPALAAGIPADLLRRRPDIREAERDLAAADERVRSQFAQLFPSVTISGQYGGQSGQVQNLADAAARYFSYGPQINWGFLSYPAAKQSVQVYRARREQQYATYKKTVLRAFQDVDDAIASLVSDEQRRQALSEEVGDARMSVDESQAKYNNGAVDLLDLLDAQRQLNSAQDALVQCDASLRTDTIALYKALGGGWEAIDPATQSYSSKHGMKNAGGHS